MGSDSAGRGNLIARVRGRAAEIGKGARVRDITLVALVGKKPTWPLGSAADGQL